MAGGWTSAEDDRLRALWGNDTLAGLAPSFGRSQARVRYRAQALGLISGPAPAVAATKGRWSESEEHELRTHWAHTGRYALSQRLGRSYGAIDRRARKMKLGRQTAIDAS